MEFEILKTMSDLGLTPISGLLCVVVVTFWRMHKSAVMELREKSKRDDAKHQENANRIINLSEKLGIMQGRIIELQRPCGLADCPLKNKIPEPNFLNNE